LDRQQMADAVKLLHDVEPIRARVTSVGITDTTTGEISLLTG